MKKAIAVCMSLLLMILCLAGCSQSKTDKNTTTAKANRPISYTYNCHLLLPQYENALTKDEITVCHRIADAVEAGDTTVQAGELDGNESFSKVWYAYIASQPIYALTESMDYNDGTITIVYKNDLNSHLELVKKWHTLITNIINSNVFEDDSETERAYTLYKYVATHITYNYEEAADVNNMLSRGAYEALTEGSGVCKDYSRVYNFLLTQCGITCYEVEDDGIDGVSHTWSMVQLNGKWYHMDATFESCDGETYSDTSYAYTSYFGMSDEKRYESRPAKWYIKCDQNYEDRIDAPACPDNLDYSPEN